MTKNQARVEYNAGDPNSRRKARLIVGMNRRYKEKLQGLLKQLDDALKEWDEVKAEILEERAKIVKKISAIEVSTRDSIALSSPTALDAPPAQLSRRALSVGV